MYVAWYIGFATLTWKWPLKKQIISAVFARYNMWRLVGLNIFHLLILHSRHFGIILDALWNMIMRIFTFEIVYTVKKLNLTVSKFRNYYKKYSTHTFNWCIDTYFPIVVSNIKKESVKIKDGNIFMWNRKFGLICKRNISPST